LFSATMPDDITALAARILQQPVRVEVTPPATTVERIAQSVFFVEQNQKRPLLLHLLKGDDVRRVLVFTRTKHGANRVAETLDKAGVAAAAIHGNKSQGARERALDGFKTGKLRALVATDLAARGIDVDGVSHVIQIDLPEVPEQYVHRIGRTARAGREGIAWAFCSSDDRPLLRDIERTIRLKIDAATHPFVGADAPSQGWELTQHEQLRGARGGHGGHGGRGGRGGGGGGGGRGGRGGGGGGRGPSSSSSSSPSSAPSSSTPRVRSFGPGRR
jgi:ATP-dependent RNA helicase RhlE